MPGEQTYFLPAPNPDPWPKPIDCITRLLTLTPDPWSRLCVSAATVFSRYWRRCFTVTRVAWFTVTSRYNLGIYQGFICSPSMFPPYTAFWPIEGLFKRRYQTLLLKRARRYNYGTPSVPSHVAGSQLGGSISLALGSAWPREWSWELSSSCLLQLSLQL